MWRDEKDKIELSWSRSYWISMKWRNYLLSRQIIEIMINKNMITMTWDLFSCTNKIQTPANYKKKKRFLQAFIKYVILKQ